MVEYMQFSSHEEMLDWLEKQRQEVQGRALSSEQEAVGYGDYFVRWIGSTTIFGRVLTWEEIVIGEDTATARRLDERHQIGWLWTFCQSDMDPHGDYGTVHRSGLWPISERLYLYAKAVDWSEDRLADWALEELIEAVDAARRHYA